MFKWVLSSLLLLICASVAGATAGPLDHAVDQHGRNLSLEQYRGKVVAVSFWASWCAPCRKELPVLDSLQRLKPQALKVIAVNWKEPARTYRKLVKGFGDVAISFTHDKQGEIAEAYGVEVIPHLILIDHNGGVASVHKGYTEENLHLLVEQLNDLLRKVESS